MSLKLVAKQIVGSHRRPIRYKPRGMTTADASPTNPHAFRLWCAGVPPVAGPKEQAEDYAEFVKVHREIEGDNKWTS